MTAGVIGGGGGAFAPLTDSPISPAISGLALGDPGDAGQSFASTVIAASKTFFVPRYISERSVDAFVISPGGANLTNDLELAIYNIDETGVKLGTKVAGATQTATFTTNTYTEITFTQVAIPEGWYFLGVSGISASAGPDLNYLDTVITGQYVRNPIVGFGINAGWTNGINIGHFEAAAALDTVAVGAALTSTIATSSPLIWLRNA